MFDIDYAMNVALPLAQKAYGRDAVNNPVPGWHTLFEIQPDYFGFLAVKDDTIAVAWRGTENVHEWLDDFEALPVQCDYCLGFVHKGFQDVYNACHQTLVSEIVSLLQSGGYSRIIITGHSLGAVLALLNASEIRDKDSRIDIQLYTWAGPRLGMSGFVSWFNLRLPNCWRIVNQWDIVPHVPTVTEQFVHCGTAIEIDSGFVPNVDEEHSLTTYGNALATKKFKEAVVR